MNDNIIDLRHFVKAPPMEHKREAILWQMVLNSSRDLLKEKITIRTNDGFLCAIVLSDNSGMMDTKIHTLRESQMGINQIRGHLRNHL